MALPPVLLVLAPDPAGPSLVASWSAGRGMRIDDAGWPDPEPGSLCLLWPGRWPPGADAFRLRLEESGGETRSLGTVLRALGLAPGRGIPGLLAALAPEVAEVDDPRVVMTLLLEGLVERLGEPGVVRDAPSGPAAHPGVLDDLARLPGGPGVYEFQTADGRALYVGKAASLRARVPQHLDPRSGERGLRIAARAHRVVWVTAGSEVEALVAEQRRIRDRDPILNRQTRVHERRRGSLRDAVLLLLLPSALAATTEICLVAGDGRFDWLRAPTERRVPLDVWRRVVVFLDPGTGAPRDPGIAEIVLTWLARHRDAVTQLDLRHERAGRELQDRLRALLAEDPAAGRIIPGG